MANPSPFDFFKSASSSAENEILSGKLQGEVDKYVFLRCFIAFEDSVLFADEINAHAGMPARYVFHSMHALVQPKRNRFSKWVKYKSDIDQKAVRAVSELYELGSTDSEELVRRMAEEGTLQSFLEEFESDKIKKPRKTKEK